MLEKLPAAFGRALRKARPGLEKLASADDQIRSAPEAITLTSSEFSESRTIPVRFTADGEAISPPLRWSGVPENAQAVVLLIEDADSPSAKPLVHAIVTDLPNGDGSLAEGEIESSVHALGRNSYLRTKYMPPDPPPGHGPHRYAFQIFALDRKPEFERAPGRSEMIEQIRGHVIARGSLIGTYERR